MQQKHPLQHFPALLGCACLCCLLWGSAIPTIKLCYQGLGIGNGAVGPVLVFAGVRFMPAGGMILLFGSVAEGRPLLPQRGNLRPILTVALFQTVLQYLFYYIALSFASGITAAILSGTNTFFAIALAVFLFRMERLTPRKLVGTLLGFGGLVLAQCTGAGGFALSGVGNGLMLLSAFSAGAASVLTRRYTAGLSPLLLSGWQFVLGGAVLCLTGLGLGGGLGSLTPTTLGALLYLALVSAVAYGLWSCLLKYNPVSRVTVFSFLIPVFGVMLSALLLQEWSLLGPALVAAMVLICVGILLVNQGGDTP